MPIKHALIAAFVSGAGFVGSVNAQCPPPPDDTIPTADRFCSPTAPCHITVTTAIQGTTTPCGANCSQRAFQAMRNPPTFNPFHQSVTARFDYVGDLSLATPSTEIQNSNGSATSYTPDYGILRQIT
jgi:hypothetical protein